jgi:hypothetical protein
LRAKAHRRRAYQLKLERSIQLLACNFSLVSDCEEFLATLDSQVQHASQNYPVSRYYRFEVQRMENGYRIREDAIDRPSQPDADAAAESLVARMYDLSMDALGEFTKIHGGCASLNGKRMVFSGPTRAGKTTLMTRLLYEGFAVYCDDIVLLSRGNVLPYPRRFWIRSQAVPLLPELATVAHRLRNTQDHLPLDPTEIGLEWHIDAAPVAAVFFLEPNHGSATELLPCPKYAMAKLIMSQSVVPSGGAQDWIRDVCAMLDKAESYVLRSGGLDPAVAAVKSVFEPGRSRLSSQEEDE